MKITIRTWTSGSNGFGSCGFPRVHLSKPRVEILRRIAKALEGVTMPTPEVLVREVGDSLQVGLVVNHLLEELEELYNILEVAQERAIEEADNRIQGKLKHDNN